MDAQKAQKVLAALTALYPEARAELHFSNPYETLVATILSAQCTDRRVNQVTEKLFPRYPTVESMAALTPEDREIFLRRYYYNQTTGQIAEALHMNPSTVRSRLLRGRQVLRTELQKGDVQIEDLCAESV